MRQFHAALVSPRPILTLEETASCCLETRNSVVRRVTIVSSTMWTATP